MERSRAGLTPTLPAVTPDGAVDALRASGRRVSAARRLVLEALFCADGPMSADQIADGIGGRVPRSDLTSVYRNLETLEEVGLVSHVHLGHGPGLYALNLDGEREWLTCERCGDFRAVDPARLDGVRAAIEAAFGYRASFAHFPVVELCESCLSALGGSMST
jgi:Fur family transcriptional regulator, ferric uptake regulator